MGRFTKSWAKCVAGVLAALLISPLAARACSVCYGEPDSPAAKGLTWAIVALAVIVGMVLSGAVMFFVHANRNAAGNDVKGGME